VDIFGMVMARKNNNYKSQIIHRVGTNARTKCPVFSHNLHREPVL
jgi:hypothetical protein